MENTKQRTRAEGEDFPEGNPEPECGDEDGGVDKDNLLGVHDKIDDWVDSRVGHGQPEES